MLIKTKWYAMNNQLQNSSCVLKTATLLVLNYSFHPITIYNSTQLISTGAFKCSSVLMDINKNYKCSEILLKLCDKICLAS